MCTSFREWKSGLELARKYLAVLVLNSYVESGREHMERIKRQSLCKIVLILLVILLVTCIIGSAQQGIAESTVDTSIGQKVEKISHDSVDGEIIQRTDNVRLAELYAPDPEEYKEQEKGATEIVFVQLIRKIQIILIGGILLIIGTFFIPALIPQFTGNHKKLYHFPGFPIADTMPGKTPEHVTMPEKKDRAVEYYTIRCDSILSPAFNLPISNPSTTGIIRKFFQQSGFAFTEISDSELRVNSPLSRYKRYGEIPVYILSDTTLNKNRVQQIYDKMRSQYQHTKTTCPYEKIAFAVVNIPPEDSAYHQIYNYRVKHNFTIIPLSHPFVTKTVRYSLCAQELEEKVNISTRQCNLYAMNTPVADPLSLFGRDDIIHQLLDAVKHQKHIGLFGLQKIGKTWLAWQFKERLSHHIATYVNLQHLPGNCSYLYRKIIDECVRDAAFKYPDLELPDLHLTRAGYTENDNNEFMRDIVSLWKCVRTKRKDIKIVLLVDGAEQLVPGDSNANENIHGFHEFLETICSISRQYGFLVSIMISTNPEIPQIDTCSSQNNSNSQSYRKVFLSPLSEDGCNQMINAIGAQMGLIYTEESLSRIYYETGGHPYVTRQLCSLITKNLKHLNVEQWTPDTSDQTTVHVRNVEQAVSEYIEYKSDYFESVWRQLSREEQEILLIISREDSCTLDDLVEKGHNQRARHDRERAISTLVENNLIERCENKYSITMGLFERLIPTSN